MINREHWLEAQEEEAEWWGNCANTFHEEEKQMVYAHYMDLDFYPDNQSPYNIDGTDWKTRDENRKGRSFVDIGGGPCSLLLKVKGAKSRVVIDPCNYPKWVENRYTECGIQFLKIGGENLTPEIFPKTDEVWIYNVLQHTEDPKKIIKNGLDLLVEGGIFRIFEWVDTPTNTAHPHCLTEEMLNEALGWPGEVRTLATKGCYGKAYSNIVTKLGDNNG